MVGVSILCPFCLTPENCLSVHSGQGPAGQSPAAGQGPAVGLLLGRSEARLRGAQQHGWVSRSGVPGGRLSAGTLC